MQALLILFLHDLVFSVRLEFLVLHIQEQVPSKHLIKSPVDLASIQMHRQSGSIILFAQEKELSNLDF